jgi:hypothetical protein
MLWRYHEFASVLMQWINQLTKHKCKIIIGTLYFSYYIIIGTSYSVIVLVLVGCRHHVIYNSVGRLPSEYIHLSQTWKHTMRHLYLAMVQVASFFIYISVCIFLLWLLMFCCQLGSNSELASSFPIFWEQKLFFLNYLLKNFQSPLSYLDITIRVANQLLVLEDMMICFKLLVWIAL